MEVTTGWSRIVKLTHATPIDRSSGAKPLARLVVAMLTNCRSRTVLLAVLGTLCFYGSLSAQDAAAPETPDDAKRKGSIISIRGR